MTVRQPVHIWIDGDSCPSKVRDFVFKYADARSLPAFFVSNKKKLDDAFANCEIVVTGQKDAADIYILENARSGDLVVTKDIVFAARALEKNICAINDRGAVFTKENISQKLADRDFDMSLAQIGFESPREKNYGKEDFAKFVAVFEKAMKRLVRERYEIS